MRAMHVDGLQAHEHFQAAGEAQHDTRGSRSLMSAAASAACGTKFYTVEIEKP
jgi:hypothetical protein